MDLTFKTAETIEAPRLSEFKENKVGASEEMDEMSDGESEILSLLGVEEPKDALPEEVQDYVDEINDAIEFLIEKRNLEPSRKTYKQLLDEMRSDMGINENAESMFALEKIGKTLKAWEDISYIRDMTVRKDLFTKLAQAGSSKEMDRIVLKALEDYE